MNLLTIPVFLTTFSKITKKTKKNRYILLPDFHRGGEYERLFSIANFAILQLSRKGSGQPSKGESLYGNF
jgi:hypothetical protein